MRDSGVEPRTEQFDWGCTEGVKQFVFDASHISVSLIGVLAGYNVDDVA
jgi:hypothetical protein